MTSKKFTPKMAYRNIRHRIRLSARRRRLYPWERPVEKDWERHPYRAILIRDTSGRSRSVRNGTLRDVASFASLASALVWFRDYLNHHLIPGNYLSIRDRHGNEFAQINIGRDQEIVNS